MNEINQLRKSLEEKLDAIDWSQMPESHAGDDDRYEAPDEADYLHDVYEDAWNDPEWGQELRRKDAKQRCSHIRFGELGPWLDCEADFDEILRQVGDHPIDRLVIFGRYRVPDFHDESKFTDEEGRLLFLEAKCSALAGRFRAGRRALDKQLGLER
jgi:hypothetical protein